MEPRKQDKLISSYSNVNMSDEDAALMSKKKWKCTQCTYENWPSSLKCTICLTSKSVAAAAAATGKKIFISPAEDVLAAAAAAAAGKHRPNVVKSGGGVKMPNGGSGGTGANKKQKQAPSQPLSSEPNLIELNFNSTKKKSAAAQSNRKPPPPSSSSTSTSLGGDDEQQQHFAGLPHLSDDIYQLGNMLSSHHHHSSSSSSSTSTTMFNVNEASDAISKSESLSCKSNSKNSKLPAPPRPDKSSSPIPLSLINALSGSQSKLDLSSFTSPPSTTTTTTTTAESPLDEIVKKWNCPACTYLNWPKSIKCVQCYTPRHAIDATTTTTTTTATSTNQNGENGGASDALLTKSGSLSETVDVKDAVAAATNVAAAHPSATTIATQATQTSMNFTSTVIASPRNTPLDRSLCNSPCTVPKIAGAVTETTPATTPTVATAAADVQESGSGGVNKDLNVSSASSSSSPANSSATTPPLMSTASSSSSTTETTSSPSLSSSTQHLNSPSTPSTPPASSSSSSSCIIENASSACDFSKKWSCAVCTYQNWPKSQRCVMCGQSKAATTAVTASAPAVVVPSTSSTATPPAPSSSRSSTPQSLSSGSNSNVAKSAPNSAPPPAPPSTTTSHLPAAAANSIQMQMDRLFLAACQGIVDGNMNYLQRFINAGGELTRALSPDEAAFLNRGPSLLMFNAGHTLIHLCCQYKRQEFLIQILNKESSSNKKVYPGASPSSCSSFGGLANSNNLRNSMYINGGRGGQIQGAKSAAKLLIKAKFSPCQSCPQLAANIVDRYFSANLRQRKAPAELQQGGAGSSFNGAAAASGGPSGSGNNNIMTMIAMPGGNGAASPTSSLISLNSGNSQAYIQFSKASFHASPSPSPPPMGAGASLAAPINGFCYYVNECHTFSLPNDIEDLSPKIQKTLFDELLDRDVEKELEIDARIINWSGDICKRLNSRLYPLWNRHSGDCLLDSVLQACYGVFDTDNTLRRAMAESLEQYSHCFKPRWKEHELSLAQSLEYTLDDNQLEQDWKNVLSLAYQPGASLEQAHIFALCHIFRRPIIIYSVKYVKSLRGENIGFTHFEGVYLPLNWEPSFCFKSPIALGYTRGHFTALVPLERNEINFGGAGGGQSGQGGGGGGGGNSSSMDAGAVSHLDYAENQQQVFYLPLTNSDGQLLPVHFLTCAEVGKERALLRQYLQVDCLVTQANGCGLYVAHQRVAKRPMLVRQMVEEWLNYYRNMQSREIGYQIEICANDENENCNEKSVPVAQTHHHHHLAGAASVGVGGVVSASSSISGHVVGHHQSSTSATMDEEDEEDDEDDDDDEEEEEEEEDDDEEEDEEEDELDEIVVLEEEDDDDDDDDDEYCVREEL